MSTRPTRRVLLTVVAVVATLPGAAVVAGADEGGPGTVLAPIGGGYETPTLEGFARLAEEGASGPVVDLVVVPSSYGDKAKDRTENLALAQERTDQVEAACEAVVSAPYTGCDATLAVLLDRKDAMDPANSEALNSPSTDGIFILGGDQGIAMQVLSGSPAEAAMARAAARGVAVAGTSAGAAVQSRTMINGYVGRLGPAEGLRQDSTLVWWGDDGDFERGLSFGSTAAIYDQHFYQRGRFGRLLSTVASSDERFAGVSLLGVGADYATGIRADGDRTLSGVFGASSVAVIDMETMHSTHRWVGKARLLSERNVVTHLLAPGTAAYDMRARSVSLDGSTVPPPSPLGWTAPTAPGAGTLFLGGDLLAGDVKASALPAFVGTAVRAAGAAAKRSRIVVVSASAGDTTTASAYAAALKTAGWPGSIDAVAYGTRAWASLDLAGATAVVVAAADPATLLPAMADPQFRSRVTAAVRTAPAFLADQHFAAALGRLWSPKVAPTEDTLEDEGIAAFRADDGQWRTGLGLVDVNVVPRLTSDYRWGRLYGLGQADPAHLAFGVADGTAISISPTAGASVVGATSVVALDGRQAWFGTGSNGAMGAVNALLDVFASGEPLVSAR